MGLRKKFLEAQTSSISPYANLRNNWAYKGVFEGLKEVRLEMAGYIDRIIFNNKGAGVEVDDFSAQAD